MRIAPVVRAAAALALALAIATPGALAQSQQRVAGDIVGFKGSTLTMRTTLGQVVTMKAPAELRVTVRAPAAWSDIATGGYVGTTAVPQADGTLLAKEVHIFTEAQRGTSEGHHPLPTPGDTMTNATVSRMSGAAPARDTMTNATVQGATASGTAHRLTLTYKGGEQTVVVPDGVPIIKSEAGTAKLLTPGTHAVVYAHRDNGGELLAERVSVGKNGSVPPI